MTKKLRITVEGKAYDVTVDVLDGGVAAPVAAAPAPVAAAPVAAPAPAPAPAPKAAAPSAPVPAGAGVVTSPLAGKVDSVDVKIGDTVAVDQNVVTLEAMKMKTNVVSSVAGKVVAISVKAGDAVEEGQALVTIG